MNSIADNSVSKTIQLVPIGDSGVSGTATYTETMYDGPSEDIEQGALVVLEEIRVYSTKGPIPSNVSFIHEGGTCADEQAGYGAPIKYSGSGVGPVTDESGQPSEHEFHTSGFFPTQGPNSVTRLAQLFDGSVKRYLTINLHNRGEHLWGPGEIPPQGIACGDFI